MKLYCALFWIQGKTEPERMICFSYCTVPYFGFKAKRGGSSDAACVIVLCLILDSRQNGPPEQGNAVLIVLCLILDSRQNFNSFHFMNFSIVLCLILDSRQNKPLLLALFS